MLTGTTIFTNMVSTSDVLTMLGQLSIVFAGIIAVLLLLSPIFFAKFGFAFVLNKVKSLVGAGGRG